MISSRVAATALSVVTVVALGGGAPRPEVELGARHAVLDAADQAAAAASRLRARLAPALDAGRAGAARIVSGMTDPPAEPLIDAAGIVEGAVADASELDAARERLERARRALDPAAEALPAAPDPGDLGTIAVQLRATADAGEAFAAMRRRAEALTGFLALALADAEAGDLEGARRSVVTARSEFDALAAWDVGAVTLPVWLDTVDAMIRAVERALKAIAGGDAEGAEAAAEALAALEDDAPAADRALRIAIGESGGTLTAPALGRLSRVLDALDELGAAIGSVRLEASGG